MYQINTIDELKSYFINNNITNSEDLGNLGIEYWNNQLKPLINPKLFQISNNKIELEYLINNNFPLLLIDTSNITNFQSLFKNEVNNNNLKSKKYWDNPVNYLGFWNTYNVTDISFCFYNQQYFNQRIYWNTKNIEDSNSLFFGCINLNQSVKLNLEKCKNISYMFQYCTELNSFVELNNLNNVRQTEGLFSCCYKFNQPIELNLVNCTNILRIFFNCEKLEFKNIEKFINQLIIGLRKNPNKLEKEIKYKIPEEYKNKITKKLFGIINQI